MLGLGVGLETHSVGQGFAVSGLVRCGLVNVTSLTDCEVWKCLDFEKW